MRQRTLVSFKSRFGMKPPLMAAKVLFSPAGGVEVRRRALLRLFIGSGFDMSICQSSDGYSVTERTERSGARDSHRPITEVPNSLRVPTTSTNASFKDQLAPNGNPAPHGNQHGMVRHC